MDLKKLIHTVAKTGGLPDFGVLSLFTIATGVAALLNDFVNGDPRVTLFAGCACALGALALGSLVWLIVDAVRDLNKEG